MLTIGALIFPGFELMDLFGPLQMFGFLPDSFAITLVAQQQSAVASSQGPSSVPQATIEEARDYDIVLVPGGKGTRREVDNAALVNWIARQAAQAKLVATVCTGAALLAKTGLLDGRRATTNKYAFRWVAAQGPNVDWQRTARWVVDGKFFTGSGVAAGIDMSLALIGSLHGNERAREIAEWAEYHWQEDPIDHPFRELYARLA
jgi:transcriptional regulator GlxA family with amidase domain